jgi:hypothetical protein
MHKPVKYFEKGLTVTAKRPGPFLSGESHPAESVVHPEMVEKPLLKSYEKTKPPLDGPDD